MINAQEWLEKKYPNKEKVAVVSSPLLKDLEGELKIEGFANLKKLVCSKNSLTGLTINNCPNLTEIDCSDNLLTKFEFTTENPEKLISINLTNNNLVKQDLSYFSQFTNLEKLYLGTTDIEKSEKKNYNRFYGSLEYLENLSKLKRLGISNTNIDSGLEYLPKKLKEIHCATRRKDARCMAVQEKLIDFSMKNTNCYDYTAWRKVNLVETEISSSNSVRSSTYSALSSTTLKQRGQVLEQEDKIRNLSSSDYEPPTSEIADWETQISELQSQLKELNSIVCPESDFNFAHLKKEIQKLKAKELVPHWKNKKSQLTDLITTLQNKAGNELKSIIELYLKTQEQMNQKLESNNTFTQGQLTAYQSILGQKFSERELSELTQLQKEVLHLEKKIVVLDLNEQESQINIEIPPK